MFDTAEVAKGDLSPSYHAAIIALLLCAQFFSCPKLVILGLDIEGLSISNNLSILPMMITGNAFPRRRHMSVLRLLLLIWEDGTMRSLEAHLLTIRG